MKQDIEFMPLGGGQTVGASCYFLRLPDANILLDAGTGMGKGGILFGPDYRALLTSRDIESLGQINQIFISHAHMDHIGSLLPLMSQATHAGVYMTEITKALTEYQLYDKRFMSGKDRDEFSRLAARDLLERITQVSYLKPIDFGKYRVTFYPAGHIPGAMMTLIETRKRKILYTGDYSIGGTAMTDGCMIPDADIDTVIMCGLHARHPDYKKTGNPLSAKTEEVLRHVFLGRSVKCSVNQLSKGIEFLSALNHASRGKVPIYLDKKVMDIVTKMESLNVPVLTGENRLMGTNRPTEPHIYLTAGADHTGDFAYVRIPADFTLHEDFSQMKDFIKEINPKKAVLVHCGKAADENADTIEQELMLDADCRTQFIFAEEKKMYIL